jgi:UDP-N-acetylmuramoyl-tripeptide--D-alanyl-D-alanine ligase
MATPIPPNRAEIDTLTAAAWTHGRMARATPGLVARGVTTDSRAITPGCAFVALRGESHDGHAFVPAAIEAGAVLVVVERGRLPPDARVDAVEVGDTLAAWGALARKHLHRWRGARPDGRVVCITGSAGKTTTKEMTAALLREAGECHASTGNLNNRVGLPAVALAVEARHRFVVLEAGMSVPGEIAELADVAQPDVGLITNVALAHAGGVGGTLDDVAREKGALFRGVRDGGTLVVNADDAAVMAQADKVSHKRRVAFGRSAGAEVRLVTREPSGIDRSRVQVERAGRSASFEVPIAGEAAALDFVAALAAAEAAAGPLADSAVAEALRRIGPMAGRMHARSVGDIVVLDDAYNANPASMRAALATLREIGQGRRVAVLGEMKELGPAAEREHAEVGAAAAAAGVALLVSCGGLADVIAQAARQAGVETVLASGAAQAARVAVERALPGDTVLVKASRSVGAEAVVDALVTARDGTSPAPGAWSKPGEGR